MNNNTVVRKREKQFLVFLLFVLIFLGGYHTGKVKTAQEAERLYIQSYYHDLELALSNLESTLSYSENWRLDEKKPNMNGFERFKSDLYHLDSVYDSDFTVKSEIGLTDVNMDWMFDHLISVVTDGFMYNTHTISHDAFDTDGVIGEREQAFLVLLHDTIEPLSKDMYDYRRTKRSADELKEKIIDVYEALKLVFNEEFYLNYNEVN